MPNQQYIINEKSFDNIKMNLIYISQGIYGDDWHSKQHMHHCTELFYVTRGKRLFQTANETLHLKEDDLVIVNPNVSHTELGYDNNLFEYIVLGFEGTEFYEKGLKLESDVFCANYQDYKHEILFYLKTLLLEVKNQEPYYQEQCQNLLEILIINIIRRSKIELHISPSKKVNRECIFVENYINEHYKENITLDHLAEAAYVNKYYLAHTFKKQKGISPINFLLEKRIEESKILLRTTNLSVNEISQIVGFSSQSYFAQSFKRTMHQTPLEYRRAQTADESRKRGSVF